MSLKRNLRALSHQTWALLEKAQKHNLKISDKTITETNLLSLLPTQGAHKLNIINFSNGPDATDWEWWLEGRDKKFVVFRIMANILKIEKMRIQEPIVKNSLNDVCTKFIERSFSSLHQSLPLINYYLNSSEIDFQKNTTQCETNNQIKEIDPFKNLSPELTELLKETEVKMITDYPCGVGGENDFGSSIISPFRIIDLLKEGILPNYIEHIIPDIRPFCCFTCPITTYRNRKSENILEHAMRNFFKKQDFEDFSILEYQFIHDSLPSYLEKKIKKLQTFELPDPSLMGAIHIKF